MNDVVANVSGNPAGPTSERSMTPAAYYFTIEPFYPVHRVERHSDDSYRAAEDAFELAPALHTFPAPTGPISRDDVAAWVDCRGRELAATMAWDDAKHERGGRMEWY